METSANVTINDVARAANVSPSSVSNYINGRHDQMGFETRQRIQEVVELLGYRPGQTARQLKNGLSMMMGLLVPTVANQFFAQMAAEVEMAAQRRGFRILLCNTQRERSRERQFAGELASYGVRGLILGSALRDPVGMLKLINRNIAVVAFDALVADIGIDGVDAVSVDNDLAIRMAADHLVELGHRDIAYATAPLGTIARDARLRAYEHEMEWRGLGAGTIFVGETGEIQPGHADTDLVGMGRQIALRILDAESRPTAVIAMNDLVAIGIVAGLQEKGLTVPGDISVIGIDDINVAGMMSPALTTLRQPFREMAEAAVDALNTRMDNPAMPNKGMIFKPQLILRASTAPART